MQTAAPTCPHLVDNQVNEPITFTYKGRGYTMQLRDLTQEELSEAAKLNLTSHRRLYRWVIKRAFVGGDVEILTQNDLLDKAGHVFRLLLDNIKAERK